MNRNFIISFQNENHQINLIFKITRKNFINDNFYLNQTNRKITTCDKSIENLNSNNSNQQDFLFSKNLKRLNFYRYTLKNYCSVNSKKLKTTIGN